MNIVVLEKLFTEVGFSDYFRDNKSTLEKELEENEILSNSSEEDVRVLLDNFRTNKGNFDLWLFRIILAIRLM